MKSYDIVCLKWGDKYPVQYVNKLLRACQRNLGEHTWQVNFHCVTDDTSGIDAEVICHPMPDVDMLGGWWWKLSLFHPEHYPYLPKRFLFLDLDVVITGSLDPFFSYEVGSAFVTLDDFMLSGINSSVFRLDNSFENPVWSHFGNCHVEGRPPDYYGYGGKVYHGDQDLIYDAYGGRCDMYPSHYARSYKKDGKAAVIEKHPYVVVFHGAPKPPDVLDIPWVKQHWR